MDNQFVERRVSNIKLYEDVAELKADIKYIIKTLDEMKENSKTISKELEDKCNDCQPAQDLKSYIAGIKDNKKWTWDRVVFSTTSVLALISILVVLMLGIININIDKHNPIVRTQQTTQQK